MPVNTEKTSEVWNRYVYLRDHGHLKFINYYSAVCSVIIE